MVSRVLVVDDSALAREQIHRVLQEPDDFEVVATACHGLAALDLAETMRPDVLTLDVHMPVMDGLQTLKHLMTRRPVPILMVSALTHHDSHVTFDCLRYGALDYVEKPGGEQGITLQSMQENLLGRLRRTVSLEYHAPSLCRTQRHARHDSPEPGPARSVMVVAAGQSGLGPMIRLVSSLPPDFFHAVVLLLDVHRSVAESLVTYLPTVSALPLAGPNEGPLRAGSLYLFSLDAVRDLTRDNGVLGFAPESSSEREGAATRFCDAASSALSRDVTLLLLSGAPEEALRAAEQVRERGGAVFTQSPGTALERSVLESSQSQSNPDEILDVEAFFSKLPPGGQR